MTEDHLIVDDLELEVRRSDRRRTVGITVDRAGELILHLPAECPVDEGRAYVEEKRLWIYKKLAEKDRLYRPAPPKEYVAGEGHLYLGRLHRLSFVDPDSELYGDEPLRLIRGRFLLHRSERPRAREHFVRWYSEHGRAWITRRVRELAPRTDAKPAGVGVQDLGFRWGSCTPEGRLLFHWRTILLPPDIVRYIVAHELVHLRIPNHSADFWTALERLMPDYEERRKWLAENGVCF
jgi:predicted metal-dependent hydrolase